MIPIADVTPECTVDSECPDNASCNNNECECNDGWIQDVVDCINFNECQDTTICDDNAICIDNEGSYDCVCNDGYVGDGTPGNCQRMYIYKTN